VRCKRDPGAISRAEPRNADHLLHCGYPHDVIRSTGGPPLDCGWMNTPRRSTAGGKGMIET